jgi:hypothetical protein
MEPHGEVQEDEGDFPGMLKHLRLRDENLSWKIIDGVTNWRIRMLDVLGRPRSEVTIRVLENGTVRVVYQWIRNIGQTVRGLDMSKGGFLFFKEHLIHADRGTLLEAVKARGWLQDIKNWCLETGVLHFDVDGAVENNRLDFFLRHKESRQDRCFRMVLTTPPELYYTSSGGHRMWSRRFTPDQMLAFMLDFENSLATQPGPGPAGCDGDGPISGSRDSRV